MDSKNKDICKMENDYPLLEERKYNKSINTIEEIEKLLTYKNINKPKKTYKPSNFKLPEGISLVEDGKENKPVNTIEEIEKLLKYDKPEGNPSLEKLIGIIKTEEVTDSVKLKKESLRPRVKNLEFE